MYYENFEKLCLEKNITASKVSRATGISTATLSSWKKNVYTPKQDKLQLIADYFGVSLDYLINGEKTIEEKAKFDARLSGIDDTLKEYLWKLNELSKEKQECVMKLIDLLK